MLEYLEATPLQLRARDPVCKSGGEKRCSVNVMEILSISFPQTFSWKLSQSRFLKHFHGNSWKIYKKKRCSVNVMEILSISSPQTFSWKIMENL